MPDYEAVRDASNGRLHGVLSLHGHLMSDFPISSLLIHR